MNIHLKYCFLFISSYQELPPGYTPNGVYPLLQSSVELSSEEKVTVDEIEDVEPTEMTESVIEVVTEDGQPDQPGQPGQPGQATQPGQPDQPDQPGQATQLTEPITEDQTTTEKPITEKEMDEQFYHLAIRVFCLSFSSIQCLYEVGSEELPMQTSSFNSKYLSQSEFINKHYASEYCRE